MLLAGSGQVTDDTSKTLKAYGINAKNTKKHDNQTHTNRLISMACPFLCSIRTGWRHSGKSVTLAHLDQGFSTLHYWYLGLDKPRCGAEAVLRVMGRLAPSLSSTQETLVAPAVVTRNVSRH